MRITFLIFALIFVAGGVNSFEMGNIPATKLFAAFTVLMLVVYAIIGRDDENPMSRVKSVNRKSK